ncbi:MAG: M4 family metallopeptidase [Bacteroidia bacterium]|nr:M4 family metallopeptidase [Bacteroidia bacterium]
MKYSSLLKFAFAITLISVLLFGCKSTMEALRMSGALGSKKQKEQTDPPKFYNVDHSSHSDLPTIIDFFPDADLTKDNFPDWVAKEMKVEIRYVRSAEGPDGNYHYYQQYHHDIEVYGTEYCLLVQEGKPVSAHGLLYQKISLGKQKFSKNQIVTNLHMKYKNWRFDNQVSKTIFPVVLNGSTRLVSAYMVRGLAPDEEEVEVFVDTEFGNVVGIEELDIHSEVGSGIRSNGKQASFGSQDLNDIPLEYRNSNWSSGYRLFDVTRNLHTLSANNSGKRRKDDDGILDNIWEDYTPAYQSFGQEIIETDNYWEESNEAIDVHWGMQKSYDYFLQNHGRKGYDGANGYLPALVNYRKNYRNAAFVRKFKFLKFGDGNPDKGFGPYTSLGIVGHEFTHALVYSICKLYSSGESGSISESLADIFGTTIEFSVEPGDWIHGNEVPTRNPRSLQDPKSTNQPDTYRGDNWRNTLTQSLVEELNNEDKIKHHNAGIMNHWYYLLCQGAKDKNDNEDHYDIKPIGMKKAADLVYRTLFRMHPTIDFEGMRKQTTDIAKKLYGKCSIELKNVTNAWNAVGVGDPFCDCFEGSYVLLVKEGRQTNKATYYYKGDKSAVEILDEHGIPRRVVTSAGDRFRHVQGYEDAPAGLLRQMFQGKNFVLTNPPVPYVSRKEFVKKRNKLRTGRTMNVSGYKAFEYKVPDGTFWSTDEVCTSLIEMSNTYAHIGSNSKQNNFRAFYGFPVKMTVDGESYWIENIREYEVPDSYFSR